MVTTVELTWDVTPTGTGRPDHTVRTVQEIDTVTLWNNESTGAGGSATGVIEGLDPATLYLSVSGATDITIELSPDGTNYYVSGIQSYSGAATDVISVDGVAYSIKLTSSNNVTATAVVYGHKVI